MNVKLFSLLPGVLLAAGLYGAPQEQTIPGKTVANSFSQTLRLVQDDAQDYMVSRVFTLKYIQANDIAPFVTGMVKRYNMNSSVSCFSYSYGSTQQQILSVTTPEKMMHCVAEFLAKADRRIAGTPPGAEIIRGTGIARGVYRPKYRSGQILVNLIVNALINAGPYSSLYGYDANSNQIYWKDNAFNTSYVYQFLSYIDRPPPQIRMEFSILELRESTLRDLGIEYLAWKNGPGLNLFQIGWQALDLSSSGSAALQSFSGPLGGFFFAPQFDASFIRILEQSGNAEIVSKGELTVSNSDSKSYGLSFNFASQNIVKNDNDRTSVTSQALENKSNLNLISIINPIVCIDDGNVAEFTIQPYFPGSNAGKPGILCFGYNFKNTGAVERNNLGTELLSSVSFSGNTVIPLNKEIMLGVWESQREVSEVIGVPFLSDIPVLKYFFSTTTKSFEKTSCFLTVKATLADTAAQEHTILYSNVK